MLGFLLFAFAARQFTRDAERSGDELLRWLGAGCALGAFARVNYLLSPPLHGVVRRGGRVARRVYLLLLVGAGREIRSYWEIREELAVLEERRLARDLHDRSSRR